MKPTSKYYSKYFSQISWNQPKNITQNIPAKLRETNLKIFLPNLMKPTLKCWGCCNNGRWGVVLRRRGCLGRHLSRPLTPKETLHLEKSLVRHNNSHKSLKILPPWWQGSSQTFVDETDNPPISLQNSEFWATCVHCGCVCDSEAYVAAANALGLSSIGDWADHNILALFFSFFFDLNVFCILVLHKGGNV